MTDSVKPEVSQMDFDNGVKEDDTQDNRLGPAQIMSPEEFAITEKRLKRKLDLRLMLCVWIIFVMNYFDRVGNS